MSWSGTCAERLRASRSCVVPTTFTEPWRVASESDCAVPVSAAKCTIWDGRDNRSAASTSGAWVTSPVNNSHRWRQIDRCMFAVHLLVQERPSRPRHSRPRQDGARAPTQ